jgi:putative transposase
VTDKYVFIDAEYDGITAEAGAAPTSMQMCRGLGVSKSGYYEWRSRPESAVAARRELLKIKIKALFEASDQAYGYRRIHAALVPADQQASDELVRQLMRELGLVPCQPRPGRRSLTEQGAAGPIPDLVSSLASLSVTSARA